jgi:DNA-binding CsgD family transcriptional regulator
LIGFENVLKYKRYEKIKLLDKRLNAMSLLQWKTFLLLVALVLFCLESAPFSFAESTLTCHCFTERSYNPADKHASDEYILVTSFNSLLSKFYGIPKRQIVMIKMSEGVSQDELLVSLKVAKITKINLRKFLGLRHENKTWAEIISGLSQNKAIKEDKILQAIRAGMSVNEAGARVIDEMIAQFYQVPGEEIAKLKMAGLNEKEIALLLLLAEAGGNKPETLMEQYTIHGRSWSEIAYNLGVKPETVGQLVLIYPDKTIPQ